MAYGKSKGRFREIRVGRFAGNMGAAEAPVKSTDVEGVPDGCELASLRLYNTTNRCTRKKRISQKDAILKVFFDQDRAFASG
jgi:hypothetical protein